MSLTLNAFTPNADQTGRYIKGVASVTLEGETKEVEGLQTYNEDGSLESTTVYGIAMRYRTSSKKWLAQAIIFPNGSIQFFGGYSGGYLRGQAPIVTGFW